MARAERKAQNQTLFREVNERISESVNVEDDAEPQTFVCECVQIGCREPITLPLREYALVREDPATFLVCPGHQDPEHEDVLVKQPGYLIVRHRAAPAADLPADAATPPGWAY